LRVGRDSVYSLEADFQEGGELATIGVPNEANRERYVVRDPILNRSRPKRGFVLAFDVLLVERVLPVGELRPQILRGILTGEAKVVRR
jgi:hypothetical protein